MNSCVVAIIGLVFLYLGYRFYGTFVERRVIEPDDSVPTPAHAQRDDQDYSPAKPIMLFGHSFSSIAGAGPILGPLIAVYNFGWMATLGWILVGSVFLGAVHDYTSLMTSVRNRGASMADVAAKVMSQRAKLVFSAFVWLALVLVVAVFAAVAAKTLETTPQVVFPTFMVIPLAIGFGWAVDRRKMPVFWATVGGLLLLFLFIFMGYKGVSFDLRRIWPDVWVYRFWFSALMVYCLFASVLPVWLLLRPRDYLSTFTIFICLALGLGGALVARAALSAPKTMGLMSAHPVVPGTQALGSVWPMLCVLVACGAISGFHALVQGGTASKQLAKESQGKFIGYGGMILEGALAVLALLAVSAGLDWSGSITEVVNGQETAVLSFGEYMKENNWIVAFGYGYGELVKALPLVSFALAAFFGIVTIKTFVLTTLDTAVRVTRYVISEVLGETIGVFRNRWVATVLSVAPAFYLGFTGAWKSIWPVFGAANQLIAALALFIVSTYLLGVRRPTRYTVIPGVFMLVTTVAALGFEVYAFLTAEQPNYVLAGVAAVLILLALFVVREVALAFAAQRRRGMESAPAPTTGSK